MISLEYLNEIREFNRLAASYYLRDLLQAYDKAVESNKELTSAIIYLDKECNVLQKTHQVELAEAHLSANRWRNRFGALLSFVCIVFLIVIIVGLL